MAYLQDYIEEAQSALFKELGVFFAFSNKQFEEQCKEEHVPYVRIPGGGLCPKKHAKEFMERHHEIVMEGVEKDKKENGKLGIINREIDNHECRWKGYVCDVTYEALEIYGYTQEEVDKVFRNRNYQFKD